MKFLHFDSFGVMPKELILCLFSLYSIVYIYLINSRLDVTPSVRHHFRTRTLSWCQISGKSRKAFTVIKLTRKTTTTTTTPINSRRNLQWLNLGKFKEEFTVIEHTHTAFQEAFREDFVNIQTSSETISYNHSILEM